MVSQGDLGKDYEHCMELQRKLDDAGSGATRGVDKERIDQIFQARLIIQHGMISYHLMFRWQPSFAQKPVVKLLQLKQKERKLEANMPPFNRIFRLDLIPVDASFFKSLQIGIQSKTCCGWSNACVPKRHR